MATEEEKLKLDVKRLVGNLNMKWRMGPDGALMPPVSYVPHPPFKGVPPEPPIEADKLHRMFERQHKKMFGKGMRTKVPEEAAVKRFKSRARARFVLERTWFSPMCPRFAAAVGLYTTPKVRCQCPFAACVCRGGMGAEREIPLAGVQATGMVPSIRVVRGAGIQRIPADQYMMMMLHFITKIEPHERPETPEDLEMMGPVYCLSDYFPYFTCYRELDFQYRWLQGKLQRMRQRRYGVWKDHTIDFEFEDTAPNIRHVGTQMEVEPDGTLVVGEIERIIDAGETCSIAEDVVQCMCDVEQDEACCDCANPDVPVCTGAKCKDAKERKQRRGSSTFDLRASGPRASSSFSDMLDARGSATFARRRRIASVSPCCPGCKHPAGGAVCDTCGKEVPAAPTTPEPPAAKPTPPAEPTSATEPTPLAEPTPTTEPTPPAEPAPPPPPPALADDFSLSLIEAAAACFDPSSIKLSSQSPSSYEEWTVHSETSVFGRGRPSAYGGASVAGFAAVASPATAPAMPKQRRSSNAWSPRSGGAFSSARRNFTHLRDKIKDVFSGSTTSRRKSTDTPSYAATSLSLTGNSPLDTPRVAHPLQAVSQAADPLATITRKADLLATVPRTADPLATVPRTADPLATVPRTTDPLATVPRKADPLATVPRTADPLATVPRRVDPLIATPRKTDNLAISNTADPVANISRKADPLASVPRAADPLAAVHHAVDRLATVPRKADPLKVTPRKAVNLANVSRTADPIATIPRSADPLAAIPRKADPVVAIPNKADPVLSTPRKKDNLAAAPRVADPLAAVPRVADPLVGNLNQADPLLSTPRKADNTRAADPLAAVPRAADPLVGNLNKVDPQLPIPRKVDNLATIPLADPLADSLATAHRSTKPRTTPRVPDPLLTVPRAGDPLATVPRAADPLSTIPISTDPLTAVPYDANRLLPAPHAGEAHANDSMETISCRPCIMNAHAAVPRSAKLRAVNPLVAEPLITVPRTKPMLTTIAAETPSAVPQNTRIAPLEADLLTGDAKTDLKDKRQSVKHRRPPTSQRLAHEEDPIETASRLPVKERRPQLPIEVEPPIAPDLNKTRREGVTADIPKDKRQSVQPTKGTTLITPALIAEKLQESTTFNADKVNVPESPSKTRIMPDSGQSTPESSVGVELRLAPVVRVPSKQNLRVLIPEPAKEQPELPNQKKRRSRLDLVNDKRATAVDHNAKRRRPSTTDSKKKNRRSKISDSVGEIAIKEKKEKRHASLSPDSAKRKKEKRTVLKLPELSKEKPSLEAGEDPAERVRQGALEAKPGAPTLAVESLGQDEVRGPGRARKSVLRGDSRTAAVVAAALQRVSSGAAAAYPAWLRRRC